MNTTEPNGAKGCLAMLQAGLGRTIGALGVLGMSAFIVWAFYQRGISGSSAWESGEWIIWSCAGILGFGSIHLGAALLKRAGQPSSRLIKLNNWLLAGGGITAICLAIWRPVSDQEKFNRDPTGEHSFRLTEAQKAERLHAIVARFRAIQATLETEISRSTLTAEQKSDLLMRIRHAVPLTQEHVKLIRSQAAVGIAYDQFVASSPGAIDWSTVQKLRPLQPNK